MKKKIYQGIFSWVPGENICRGNAVREDKGGGGFSMPPFLLRVLVALYVYMRIFSISSLGGCKARYSVFW